ncbi:hypothetical protein PR003_g19122 [Phytophthora rubi]|uniref:Secreted protein n=1 Tax=Phytophthora rubi TaxID=129364 RepID=A0A6A4DYB7_9STRA|nr:hypothetical protein PR002_g21211 [Phytophthora rubi]KAE8993292.1 hypothetical protein PR001_g20713 [Phytophthora rubi]KAE9314928.1 hypothetical protein PR003_g19122 [Phytophthora rubi]
MLNWSLIFVLSRVSSISRLCFLDNKLHPYITPLFTICSPNACTSLMGTAVQLNATVTCAVQSRSIIPPSFSIRTNFMSNSK